MNYGFERKLVGFYGGNRSHGNWLSRGDLMAALVHFGWRDIEVGFEQPDHPPRTSQTAGRRRADKPPRTMVLVT